MQATINVQRVIEAAQEYKQAWDQPFDAGWQEFKSFFQDELFRALDPVIQNEGQLSLVEPGE